jgi:hypothetical protein
VLLQVSDFIIPFGSPANNATKLLGGVVGPENFPNGDGKE